MRESRSRGSVRGALSNERPYRDKMPAGSERRKGVARPELRARRRREPRGAVPPGDRGRRTNVKRWAANGVAKIKPYKVVAG